MKKWTVVIEIQDDGEPLYNTERPEHLRQQSIADCVSSALRLAFVSQSLGFQIMETIEAPYGPQHPDGVFIADSSRKGNFRQ